MAEEKDKKPDNIVYNTETEQYNANILPYGSNVGAPAIQVEDVTAWKSYHANKANHHFKSRFDELKKAYKELLEEVNCNDIIFNARYNFEPIIGQVYHLYQGEDHVFLSMIKPHECTFEHIGSFRLSASNVWERVPSQSKTQ